MGAEDADVPQGFGPLFRTSALLETLGPFYGRGRGLELVVGLRAAPKHANARGLVHGGVLATLSDIALGYALASSAEPPLALVTASMTVDYTGAAKIGDWIEARVDSARIGRSVAFGNAYLFVGDARVARASAVFAVPKPA